MRLYMTQYPPTVPSGELLSLRCSSCCSASNAPPLNPIRSTCRFCAHSEAEASNDDGDSGDKDNKTVVHVIGVLVYSLVYRQVTGERQETGQHTNIA